MEFQLSSEVAQLQRSIIRDLLKLDNSPQTISLAGGLPAGELLPLEEYQHCLEMVLKRDGPKALQYSSQYEPLRAWIAAYMQRRGVDCTAEQVWLTNGNQYGLTLLSRLLLNPGDTAAIETFTFTGVQQATQGRGAHIRPIPVDLATGADVDALEEIFKKEPRPKLAVIIPDFHNPLGVSLTAEKRERIAALAATYEVPVIEDDPYSALRFEGEMLPPIKAYDQEGWVFYMGSFSKMLAPALRLGWIIAPKQLSLKIQTLREATDLETSTLTQRATAAFLNEGLLEPHLERLNAENKRRRNALLDGLETHFSGTATWTIPAGGLFTWMSFPEDVDAHALFEQALDRHVIYIPGLAFDVTGQRRNNLRLNFSNNTPERLQIATSRLAEAFLIGVK